MAQIKKQRLISSAISGVVILFGWVLIYLGSIFEQDIQSWTLKTLGNAFIGEWSATFIMTFVNYFIPWVLGIVGEMEEWDFAAEVLYTDLWKNYYTTMLNIIIFLWIQLGKYLNSSP